MAKFSEAREGDVVYSILHGDGKIVNVRGDGLAPIDVEFQDQIIRVFTTDGKWTEIRHWEDNHPILYWSKPQISDDKPPKRKVKKVGYVNIYQNSEGKLSCGLISDKPFSPEEISSVAAWKYVANGKIEYEMER